MNLLDADDTNITTATENLYKVKQDQLLLPLLVVAPWAMPSDSCIRETAVKGWPTSIGAGTNSTVLLPLCSLGFHQCSLASRRELRHLPLSALVLRLPLGVGEGRGLSLGPQLRGLPLLAHPKP